MLVGPGHSAERLQRFLTRNGYPHRVIDTEADPGAGGLLACLLLAPDQLPVVVSPDHRILRNPSTAELADRLGLTEAVDPARVHDVAVVGAGRPGWRPRSTRPRRG